MAIYKKTEEELEMQRREEWEILEYQAAQDAAKRQHDLQVAQLRYRTQPRHKAVAKVCIAFAKAPALCVLAITIPVLILRDREVPKYLQDFLSL